MKRYKFNYIDGRDLKAKAFETFAENEADAKAIFLGYTKSGGDFDDQVISLHIVPSEEIVVVLSPEAKRKILSRIKDLSCAFDEYTRSAYFEDNNFWRTWSAAQKAISDMGAESGLDEMAKKLLLNLLQEISYAFEAYDQRFADSDDVWKAWSLLHKTVSEAELKTSSEDGIAKAAKKVLDIYSNIEHFDHYQNFSRYIYKGSAPLESELEEVLEILEKLQNKS